jgi:hypothetical protein
MWQTRVSLECLTRKPCSFPMGSLNFHHQMSLELRLLGFSPHAELRNFMAFVLKLIVIVGFQDLVIFLLYVTPHSVLEVNRRFGALCPLFCPPKYLRNSTQFFFLASRCKICPSNSPFGVKNAVFLDVTSCGSWKSQLLGRTYLLHHQGDNNRRARNNVSSN